jgi:peroxiredoxin
MILSQEVGEEAPDFILTSTDNETIILPEYRGKVVYLFFFGWG